MATRVIDITRRQLLRGAGGATLALPFLPSLLAETAYGADPTFTRQPRLFWLTHRSRRRVRGEHVPEHVAADRQHRRCSPTTRSARAR